MKNKIYSFIQKMLCLGHLPALVSKTANRLHLLCTSTQLSTNPLPWMTLTSVCSCHTVIFLNVWPTFFHRQSLNFLHSLKTPTKLLVYSILPDTFRVIPTPSPFFFPFRCVFQLHNHASLCWFECSPGLSKKDGLLCRQ